MTEQASATVSDAVGAMLWRALGAAGPGFYIDAEAADPAKHSVASAFSERGWRGLSVARSPEVAMRLRQARPRDIVVVAEPGTTLAALCREHVRDEAHLLIAGAAMLGGADLVQARPWVVLVTEADPAEANWRKRLSSAGYVAVRSGGPSHCYVAQEHDLALAPAFRHSPPPAAPRPAAEQVIERPLPAGPPEPALPQRPQPWQRRAALSLYGLVRPLLRPLAWRLRSFMLGELRGELAEIRARQDALLTRFDHLEALCERLARPDLGRGEAWERLVLTAALERE